MGSTQFYPGRSAEPHRDGLAPSRSNGIRSPTRSSPNSSPTTGYVTVAETAPRPCAVSRRRRGGSAARRAGLPAIRRPGRPARLATVVGLVDRRVLAPPVRSGQRRRRTGSTTRWCRWPTPTPSPTPAGRAGGCRPRRSGSTPHAAARTTTYAWGDEPTPGGALMANTWQGRFPYRNDGAAGWVGTSPVGHVPAERVRPGRHDRQRLGVDVDPVHRAPPTGASRSGLLPAAAPTADPTVNQALKGGSHLCAPEYCHRYRPAARSPQSQDSATTHIGFRCVV